ncbi:dTDP-4-dehydrorhamnose reductase [candidate division WOR-3 bacterium]|nr:dTDP-4-dehydrorhamnose reductase [candidate division WOR-3 bacterium]
MKTVLLTGGEGAVASVLKNYLQNFKILSPSKKELDVTDRNSLNTYFKINSPDIVIHTAAITDVDYCQNNPLKAMEINTTGTGNICDFTSHARLIFYSSDYVFDGKSKKPYNEKNIPNPISVYGKSKLEAENIIQRKLSDYLIIRTSWLLTQNGGFIKKISEAARVRNEINVVGDFCGSPTVIDFLCEGTVALVNSQYRGIVNVSNSGETTWFEIAKYYFQLKEIKAPKVIKTSSRLYPNAAPRPEYSVLDLSLFSSVTGIKPPDWKYSLEKHVQGKKIV